MTSNSPLYVRPQSNGVNSRVSLEQATLSRSYRRTKPAKNWPEATQVPVGNPRPRHFWGHFFAVGLVLAAIGLLIVSLMLPTTTAVAAPGQPTYKVAFNEAGLPKNTSWSVDLGGSVHSSIGNWVIFPQISNGTYTFSISTSDTRYAPVPGNGNVTVAGFAVYPLINFTVEMYPVIFEESGLPVGTSWTVTLNGTQASSDNSTLVIDKHNGTFPFSVVSAHNLYAPRPGNGYVTVNGGSRPEYIAFNAFTYPVRFERADSYSGTVDLEIGSAAYTVPANSSVTVEFVNGTYSFTAQASGTASVKSGSFTVAGAGVTVPLVVSCASNAGCLPPPNVTSSGPGSGSIPGGEFVVVAIAILAASLLALGGVLAWRSWRRAEERTNRNTSPPRGFG
jgi:hypothetical protein